MSSTFSSTGDGINLTALAGFPALAPPPGVTPNFTNPDRQSSRFVVSGAVLLGFMVFFLCSRIYTKCFIRRKAAWDDLTCLLAAIGAIAYYVVVYWGVTRGSIGAHQWDVTVADVLSDKFLIPNYLGVVLVSPIFLCAKLTFFLMYLQVFWPSRWLRIYIYIGAASTAAFYVGASITQFVFSTPKASETWLSVALSGGGDHAKILSVPLSAVGLAVDLYILILPIGGVWQLQLTTRRKFGVILIFMTGALCATFCFTKLKSLTEIHRACLASLLSLYYRVKFDKTDDLTWALIPVYVTTMAEMNIGVICSCMPSFAQLLRHHLPPYEAFQPGLHSRFSSLLSMFNRRSDHSKNSSTKPGPSISKQGSHYDGNGPYLNLQLPPSLRDEPPSMGYELGHLQSVRTFIGGGKREKVDNDGIHLKYEVQHNSERYDEINEVPGRR